MIFFPQKKKNRWLSIRGKLVLLMSVLEAIHIYWHLMAHIPKWILDNCSKERFNFIWRGNSDKMGTRLTSRKSISKPKGKGGYGIKNIFHFGNSLEAKSPWNILTKYSLWKIIIIHKYIAPGTLIDWIRRERKSTLNFSNH